MVIYLERGADLYMAQLMPLPLTDSCFSKIQIGFTFLVPAHLGSPGQRAGKRLCACVCVCVCVSELVSTIAATCLYQSSCGCSLPEYVHSQTSDVVSPRLTCVIPEQRGISAGTIHTHSFISPQKGSKNRIATGFN